MPLLLAPSPGDRTSSHGADQDVRAARTGAGGRLLAALPRGQGSNVSEAWIFHARRSHAPDRLEKRGHRRIDPAGYRRSARNAVTMGKIRG